MNGKTRPRDSWRVLAAANTKPPRRAASAPGACGPPVRRANAQVQTREKQTTMRDASKLNHPRGLPVKRQR